MGTGPGVDFNFPHTTGAEFDAIREAIANGHLSADGPFSHRCEHWLADLIGCRRAFLTHSATAALEMAVLLADIGPGDEVILPSYTFVSTANAVVLRGAVPVFVDIRPDTLTLDPDAVAAAVTGRTRAIMPVHYAAIAADPDRIQAIADAHGLMVIEDAAHGVYATWRGRQLGSLGALAALSFHETKNLISGEGGALLVNDESFIDRADILRHKGTNRTKFLQGEVDKYTWVDLGGSFAPNEITAAFLFAQFQQGAAITARRVTLWQRYQDAFAGLEAADRLRRPVVPADCVHNGHLYYLLFADRAERVRVQDGLRARGIHAPFHYVPLHSAPAGRRYGRVAGAMAVTDATHDRLLRLPLFADLTETDQDRVIAAVRELVAR